ncbi:Hypothetical_protein [Hexamita inflata]|uniref:Hypothetical_protein n=1 Tax=Hexamita inflata TaxID=28002 RepID=A0AA86N6Q5_9EUKA|nr:Hypothetical protein HINF_LOCUS1707 [Hexamita inflata]CAI9952304.1 Hypothetical protein HINF_LOCUS39949 [Hexamita inflata]
MNYPRKQYLKQNNLEDISPNDNVYLYKLQTPGYFLTDTIKRRLKSRRLYASVEKECVISKTLVYRQRLEQQIEQQRMNAASVKPIEGPKYFNCIAMTNNVDLTASQRTLAVLNRELFHSNQTLEKRQKNLDNMCSINHKVRKESDVKLDLLEIKKVVSKDIPRAKSNMTQIRPKIQPWIKPSQQVEQDDIRPTSKALINFE